MLGAHPPHVGSQMWDICLKLPMILPLHIWGSQARLAQICKSDCGSNLQVIRPTIGQCKGAWVQNYWVWRDKLCLVEFLCLMIPKMPKISQSTPIQACKHFLHPHLFLACSSANALQAAFFLHHGQGIWGGDNNHSIVASCQIQACNIGFPTASRPLVALPICARVFTWL